MKTPSLSVTTPSPPFTAQRSFRDQRVIGSIRNVMLQRQFSYEDSPPSSSFSDSAPRRTSIVAAVASAVAPPTSSSIPGHLEGHDSRYASIPQMEMTKLPRGGIILQSKALRGPIQFGIPPETIKDSMTMGLPVPEFYIVPVERFCRDLGPALGVNLAEFEFPAYFNFFCRSKSCTLIVDSIACESEIRSVFNETLYGPSQFRGKNGHSNLPSQTSNPADFHPSVPLSSRPDFSKEFAYFRLLPGKTLDNINSEEHEIRVDSMLRFCHFKNLDDHSTDLGGVGDVDDPLGGVDELELELEEEKKTPPPSSPYLLQRQNAKRNLSIKQESLPRSNSAPDLAELAVLAQHQHQHQQQQQQGRKSSKNHSDLENSDIDIENPESRSSFASTTSSDSDPNSLVSSFDGLVSVVLPTPASDPNKARVEIFRMTGGTEYVLHDINDEGIIVGKAQISGHLSIPKSLLLGGFDDAEEQSGSPESWRDSISSSGSTNFSSTRFHPPTFGITTLGNSHGFDKTGSTSGYVLWINGVGIMIDPPPYASATLERSGISPKSIAGIIITHCHADHDAGAFQRVLQGRRIFVITTPTIYTSFLKKYSALSLISIEILRRSHRFRSAIIGEPLQILGGTFSFFYSLHTIPCIGFRVEWGEKSIVFSGDHLNDPAKISMLIDNGLMSPARGLALNKMPLQETNLLLHETGVPPIHTPLSVLEALPPSVLSRMYVVHTSALADNCSLRVAPTGTAGTLVVVDNDRKSRKHPSTETDTWFLLSLLSSVPFVTDLDFTSTTELFGLVKIEVFEKGEKIMLKEDRDRFICMVFEGTFRAGKASFQQWHGGDWSGPGFFQPDEKYSFCDVEEEEEGGDCGGDGGGDENENEDEDVFSCSTGGTKVIKILVTDFVNVLNNGSALYRRFLARQKDGLATIASELIETNAVLKKLNSVNKMHWGAIAQGPVTFKPGEVVWKYGDVADRGYMLVSGSAVFELNMSENMKKKKNLKLEMLKMKSQSTASAPILKQHNSRSNSLQEFKGLSKSDSTITGGGIRLANRKIEVKRFVFGKGTLLLDVEKMCMTRCGGSEENFGNTCVEGPKHDASQEHDSTCVSPDGCVCLVFSKVDLVDFLDKNQGLLLNFLGLKVII